MDRGRLSITGLCAQSVTHAHPLNSGELVSSSHKSDALGGSDRTWLHGDGMHSFYNSYIHL